MQAVEGNTVVIKMSTGEIRTVTVPDSRTATIDGKEITVHDLKVGTTLTATYTTTKTPVIERTVSNLTGRVWFVAGTTVILTLPDNTNKQYKATDDMKFIVNGKPATVFELKKGMQISAEKIVEAPLVEIASNTAVTGHAPTPRAEVAPPPSPSKAAQPAPTCDPSSRPPSEGQVAVCGKVAQNRQSTSFGWHARAAVNGALVCASYVGRKTTRKA